MPHSIGKQNIHPILFQNLKLRRKKNFYKNPYKLIFHFLPIKYKIDLKFLYYFKSKTRMNTLIKNMIEKRLKGNLSGMSNHAAYLFPAGKRMSCVQRTTKLWRKPL